MKRRSAETYFAALLSTLMLQTQTEIHGLRRELALFALILWVAVAKKFVRANRKHGPMGLASVVSEVDALLTTKFRNYEKILLAKIEAILVAQQTMLVEGGQKITVDAKFGRVPKLNLEEMALFGATFRQHMSVVLANFRTRVFSTAQIELGRPSVLMTVFGPGLEEAEELYEDLGGTLPESARRQQVLGSRAEILLKRSPPALGLMERMFQYAGDLAYAGLMTQAWGYFSRPSTVRGFAAHVLQDDRTSKFCQGLVGGVWDSKTGKALPESAVVFDFPGRPPYHPNCRTILFPWFVEGLEFSNGVKTTGVPVALTMTERQEIFEEIQELDEL